MFLKPCSSAFLLLCSNSLLPPVFLSKKKRGLRAQGDRGPRERGAVAWQRPVEEPAAALLPTVATRGRSPCWKPAGPPGRIPGCGLPIPRLSSKSRGQPEGGETGGRRGQDVGAGVGRELSAPGVPRDPLPLSAAGAGAGPGGGGGGLRPSHRCSICSVKAPP